MHIFFSGIGAGIGPLALVAYQAGFTISGSDKQDNSYVQYLREHADANIYIGQTEEAIHALHTENPIDWLVYSSAVEKENPNHPELKYAKSAGIRMGKRDDFISMLLDKTGQKMIAIAGTHGKTTTTAMTIWLMKELDIPISYSVGAKLSFGEMGEYNPQSEYFVYEADEYDRNFLSYNPALSIIAGIGYDHPDIYPTRDDYYSAFRQFLTQSDKKILWEADAERIGLTADDQTILLCEDDKLDSMQLTGRVNRMNAYLVISAINRLLGCDLKQAQIIMNRFSGVSRRFERIANNIYSDYAHTPEKIRGAIQIAQETARGSIVVVYEGLHNTRQHFIKDELPTLFKGCDKLYIVPSYLAREDLTLEILTPQSLCTIIQFPGDREPAELNENLRTEILEHANKGDLVLCLSAGGANSLDEWLRKPSYWCLNCSNPNK